MQHGAHFYFARLSQLEKENIIATSFTLFDQWLIIWIVFILRIDSTSILLAFIWKTVILWRILERMRKKEMNIKTFLLLTFNSIFSLSIAISRAHETSLFHSLRLIFIAWRNGSWNENMNENCVRQNRMIRSVVLAYVCIGYAQSIWKQRRAEIYTFIPPTIAKNVT